MLTLEPPGTLQASAPVKHALPKLDPGFVFLFLCVCLRQKVIGASKRRLTHMAANTSPLPV